jgi:hypothetical protein
MSDNSVQTEFLTSQRIQHNLDVRRTGIKYWSREQKQGWNQFCIDEEMTDRIKTNSSHPEWHGDETDGANEFDGINGIDRTNSIDGIDQVSSGEASVGFDSLIIDHPGSDDLISNYPIINYAIGTACDTTRGAAAESESVNIWLPQPQTKPAEQTAIEDWVCTIAKRPETPIAVLRSLATNTTADVRIAVAHNPATTTDILLDLAGDSDSVVRYAIAENHTIPTEVLEILSDDADPCVSGRARRTMERLIPTGQ